MTSVVYTPRSTWDISALPRSTRTSSAGNSTTRTTRGSSRAHATMDLGLLKTGYLEKATMRGLALKSQRRYVVLTEKRLHWYKKTEGADLFGEQVGSVAVREIAKVTALDDQHSFEVVSLDRKRLFKALDPEERDHWVSAILEAIKDAQHADASGMTTTTIRSHMSVTGAGGTMTPRTLTMSDEEALVDIISYKTQTSEVVVSRGPAYGTTIPLVNVSTDDAVVVWLKSGAYVLVEGKEVAAKLNRGQLEVTLSDGRGALSLKFYQAKKPKVWFKEPSCIRDWALGLVGVYIVNLVGLLLVVAYLSYTTYERYQRSLAAVGQVDMVVEAFQPVVDAEAAKRAASFAIPPKFVVGCKGDMIEARRRWDITRKWREDFKIDTILDKPHPHFHIIKKWWPHCFLPVARSGEPVYLERTGQFKMPEMLAAGVTLDDLMHHSVYVTEFLYHHLMEDYHTQRLVTIFDLNHADLSNLRGEAKVFLKKVLTFLQLHYVERSRVIIIANAPVWLPILWRIIRPLLNELTQQKVRIASSSETYKALLEFITPENIPVEYGGLLKLGEGRDGCMNPTVPEVKLYDFVKAANARDPKCKKPMRVCD